MKTPFLQISDDLIREYQDQKADQYRLDLMVQVEMIKAIGIENDPDKMYRFGKGWRKDLNFLHTMLLGGQND